LVPEILISRHISSKNNVLIDVDIHQLKLEIGGCIIQDSGKLGISDDGRVLKVENLVRGHRQKRSLGAHFIEIEED
jgi:hypothetical protein